MAVPATDKSMLVEKSVFLRISSGLLGNSRKVDAEEILKTDADKAAFRVNKELLESPELKAIQQADNKIRAYVKLRCLPYVDMGILILPNVNLDSVYDALNEYTSV